MEPLSQIEASFTGEPGALLIRTTTSCGGGGMGAKLEQPTRQTATNASGSMPWIPLTTTQVRLGRKPTACRAPLAASARRLPGRTRREPTTTQRVPGRRCVSENVRT